MDFSIGFCELAQIGEAVLSETGIQEVTEVKSGCNESVDDSFQILSR